MESGGYGMSNIKNEIHKAKENLPYTFVPVGNDLAKPEEADFNKLKKGDEELFSGHLDCKMYALNPLLVGNEHEEKPLSGEDKYTEIYPLKIDDKILISPYTLKGCVSNFLAAFLGAKMKRVNEQRFSFRPNINLTAQERKDNAEYFWGCGIVTGVTKESITFRMIKRQTKFKHTDTHRYIKMNEYDEKIRDYDITKQPMYNRKKEKYFADYYFFPYQNGIDGLGILVNEHTKGMTEEEKKECKSKPHNAIGFEKRNFFNGKTITITNENVINGFKKTTNLLKKYIINHKELSDNQKNKILGQENWKKISTFSVGDPIFFEYDKNLNIKTFGKTFYYPWAFKKGLSQNDFKDDIRKESDLTILEEMFGYSFQDEGKEKKNKSKSGKVHFNFAVPVSQYQTKSYILKRPGEPKPSSYEFYLQQPSDKKLQAYGEPLVSAENTRLSGRKFYKTVINQKLQSNSELKKYSIKLTDVIEASVKDPVEFKVRVNFENLTKYELSLLKFALCLDGKSLEEIQTNKDFFCHQIGYAKNYGIGAVKFQIENSSKIFSGEDFLTNKSISDSNFDISDKISILKKSKPLKKSFGIHNEEFHYPGQDSMNDDSGKTLEWHSDIRQEYAKQRRKPKYNQNKHPYNRSSRNSKKPFQKNNQAWKNYSKPKRNEPAEDNPFRNL
jgi:CRISPR-associated protein (TIGR03986 family)